MSNILNINKYHLTPKDIKNLGVNRDRVNKESGFWYNAVIKAWCTSGGFGPNMDGTEFWLCVYDKPRKNGKAKIEFHFWVWSGMGEYIVDRFFDPADIEHEGDYRIQRMFIERVNELIDAGVFSMPNKGKGQ